MRTSRHNVIRRALARAHAEAAHRGARLTGVDIRLGGLADCSEDCFRDEFGSVCCELRQGAVGLHLSVEPQAPVRFELVRVEMVPI